MQAPAGTPAADALPPGPAGDAAGPPRPAPSWPGPTRAWPGASMPANPPTSWSRCVHGGRRPAAGGLAACAKRSRRMRRWPCSRSAATGAANCSPVRPRPAGARRSGRGRQRSRLALARLLALLWDAGLAGQPGGAFRRAVPRGRRRPDRADRAARGPPACRPRWGRCGIAAAIAADRPGLPRATTFLPSARNSACGTRASATPPTTWSRILAIGPGGLRDLHMLGWLAQRAASAGELSRWSVDPPARTRPWRWNASVATVAPALRLHLAGGARSACASTTRKPLAARLGYADDAGRAGVEKMMQAFRSGDRAADRRTPAATLRGTFRWRRRTGTDRCRLRAPAVTRHPRPWLAGADPAHAFALMAAWAADPAARAFIRRPRANWRRCCRRSRPHRCAARAARRLHGPCCAPAAGAHAGADGAAGRARALDPGVLAGHRAHAVRPVPRLHRGPAHADGAAQHRPLRQRRGRRTLQHRARRLAAPAQAGVAAARRAVPRHRQGSGGDHSELGAVDAREFCAAQAIGRRHRAGRPAWSEAPADVGDRAEAGHRRSCGDPSLRRAGQRPRAADLICTC